MKRAFQFSRRRGSVLLIVLVTLVFAAAALTLFIEKADTDLLVDIRAADAARLRLEAYSALETTIGVLEDFRIVNNGLHSPAEGWGNPLEFAGYEPLEQGNTVEVALEDESAKLSLASVKPEVLTELFKYWQVPQDQAEQLTDALMGWMKKDYVATSTNAPRVEDYEATPQPFDPPLRPLRSFAELMAIEGVVRSSFFDGVGQPNDLHRRFTETFSLYRFKTPNINGNKLEPLLAQSIYDDQQQQRINEYLTGAGTYQTQGPGFFKSTRTIAAVAGGESAKLGYGTTVAALRITVTVRHGLASFQLSAVIAPDNGATVVPPSNFVSTEVPDASATTSDKSSTSTAATSTTAASTIVDQKAQPSKSQADTTPTAVPTAIKLNYPFTFLEIRENDKPVLPPPVPTEP
jgi:general secretion pathway protein K